jgi:hypothetical protein
MVCVACGGGGSSQPKPPAQRACDAQSQINAAVQSIQKDLTSGNFDDAKKQLAQIRLAYDSLTSAVGDLGSDKRGAITPHFDDLQNDINMLNDVNSIDGLKVAFDQAQQDLQSARSTIQTTLSCA